MLTRAFRMRDERGNLTVAMAVLMILTFLAVAALARSLGTLGSVRRSQDYSAALAVAEGGVADAIWQVDQGGATAAFAVDDRPLGAGTYDYAATPLDVHTWQVRSEGTVNGVPHAVKTTLRRDPRYDYVLFTGTLVNSAAIGSNHAITVNGGGGASRQDYYTPAGSCSGCPNPLEAPGPRKLDQPVLPATYRACPATFTGVIDGQAGVPFVCNSDVEFTGTLTVINGPLLVYVSSGNDVSMADAVINDGGRATDFRLFMLGGELTVGNGNHAVRMTGIVDAPRANLTVNGGQIFIRGALLLNQFRVNGGPNMTMQYDPRARDLAVGRWGVADWHEVPS